MDWVNESMKLEWYNLLNQYEQDKENNKMKNFS